MSRRTIRGLDISVHDHDSDDVDGHEVHIEGKDGMALSVKIGGDPQNDDAPIAIVDMLDDDADGRAVLQGSNANFAYWTIPEGGEE